MLLINKVQHRYKVTNTGDQQHYLTGCCADNVIIKPPLAKRGLYAMMLSIYMSVRLSVACEISFAAPGGGGGLSYRLRYSCYSSAFDSKSANAGWLGNASVSINVVTLR